MLRGITVTSILVTIAAAVCAALDVTGISGNAHAQVGDHDAAIISAVAAVALWLVRWRAKRDDERARARAQADEDRTVLIRTLASAVPPRPVAKSVPFPRVL